MGTLCSPFYYDIVASLNAEKDLYSVYNEYKKQNAGKKILAVTYNHRTFNLHEKNYIKALIDHFNFDHLMFSLRPSAIQLIKQNRNIDLNKFREIAQVIFVLQTMARYEISTGLISSKYLELEVKNGAEATVVLDKVISYLNVFSVKMAEQFRSENVEKTFCSLFSIKYLREKLEGKSIVFNEEVTEGISETDSLFVYENQISELEKDIFWIGFDSQFKEVPWDKQYPETKWNSVVRGSNFGTPLYQAEIRYCNRCCMPETMEGITFDEFGICTPCRSSEEKMHINWEEREERLRSLLDSQRSDIYYDCLLPMSGGKDSTFQAYVLTHRYNVTALAVTHGANWMSLSGRYNLENCLQKFDLDHIIFHANRAVINKAARKSLKAIGDACWHCHIGAGTFVIQSAFSWNVKLMIWGESIAERDGRGSYMNQTEASLYYNLEISGRVKAEDYADEDIPYNELSHWFYPDKSKIQNSNIRYLHLGDYIFWDEEKQVDFLVRNFEWMDSKVENAFKGYKSNECVMAGVHDYSNFIKRGIGRATVQASDDVRRGIITREEGFELAKQFDTQRPHALDFYLKITGYTEEEFEKILIEARSLSTYASKLKDKKA
jgi:N-acetyl sugar amidotransferase